MIGNEDEVLREVEEFLLHRTRLAFPGHKQQFLRKKVLERVTELELDPPEYLRVLRRDPAEERTLLNRVTVNETSFFRNPAQFAYLRERVLPELEEERNRQVIRSWGDGGVSREEIMTIRVLSAGCSTGEEPYSVAMTILDTLRFPRAWTVAVTAGDISDRCLRVARRGFYPEGKKREVPGHLLSRFTSEAEGGFSIGDEIRKSVTFAHLNLMEVMAGAPFPGNEPLSAGFDLIFCRNVMIYFPDVWQQELVTTLFRALAPGGYLFTGDAEPLHLFRHDFEPVRDAGCIVYRKRN